MDLNRFIFILSQFPEVLNDDYFIEDLFRNGSLAHFNLLFYHFKLQPNKLFPSNTKKSLLHYAVIYDRLELLQEFIKFTDLVYLVDIDGMTILHWSVTEDLLEITEFIVSAAPDMQYIFDNYNKLPKDYVKEGSLIRKLFIEA